MDYKEVFISYKSEDVDEARWVKNMIEENGISCWMAPECIPGGSSYAREIPTAIKNCKAFVLILSSRAQKSEWIPRELDCAINAKKKVLPFMLENCELIDEFVFYLSNVQWYSAYENKVETAKKLVSDILSIIKGAALTDVEQTEVKVVETKNDSCEIFNIDGVDYDLTGVINLIKDDNLIKAVKELKNMTSLGLVESKNIVDDINRRLKLPEGLKNRVYTTKIVPLCPLCGSCGEEVTVKFDNQKIGFLGLFKAAAETRYYKCKKCGNRY